MTRFRNWELWFGIVQTWGAAVLRPYAEGHDGLAEIAPVVEFVGVFTPAVAYVGAVVHVGDQDVFDA
jgi:hypothetical protein